MRKTLLFCCCLLAMAQTLFGQVYSTNFHDVTQQPCPFDNSVTVTYPQGWIIYQTLDGTWGGPVDTERCISVEQTPGGDLRIDLGQVNPDEPLFVRALPSELANMGELPVNTLMVIDFFWWSGGLFFSGDIASGPSCVEDMCTGVFAGVEVGVPGAMRIHTGLANEDNYEHSCFPTEYFQGQYMRELILKTTFTPGANLSGKYLSLAGVLVSPTWSEVGLFSEVEANDDHFNGTTGEFDVPIHDAAGQPGWIDQYLMLYTEPTFPSAATPAYVEGNVNPSSSQQQTINLKVDLYQTLEIQPFTHLRGALVDGSDTLRHIVNLYNFGGNICVNFIDLIFSGENEYRHGKGGILDMNNSFSCFQFRHGSALHVMDDATLHYGTNGSGMLALCATSTIKLEPHSTLLVDAVMNIAECDDAIDPTHIYMDLPQTASLIFTENARLTNRFSQGRQMNLYVRMLGGTLDDSRLSGEDRALIKRIYPEPAPVFANNFSLSPNPFQNASQLSYLSAGKEQLTVQWWSSDGKLLSESQLSAEQGMNEWPLENAPAAAGLYMLHIDNGREVAVLKTVRTE